MIDLSLLDHIGEEQRGNLKPSRPLDDKLQGKHRESSKNGFKELEEGINVIANRTLTRTQQEMQENSRIFREYQENIKASEALRAEINKSLADDGREADLATLLLKAIKIISLVTKDDVFFKQNEKILKG